MQEKIGKCPCCGVKMKVINSKNEIDKRFHCPKCGTLLHVKFPPLFSKESLGSTQVVDSDCTVEVISGLVAGGVGGYLVGQEVGDDINIGDTTEPYFAANANGGEDYTMNPFSQSGYTDPIDPDSGMSDYMSDADVSLMA